MLDTSKKMNEKNTSENNDDRIHKWFLVKDYGYIYLAINCIKATHSGETENRFAFGFAYSMLFFS